MAEPVDLNLFGWDDFFAREFEPHAEASLEPARVVIEHRGSYVLVSRHGELRGELTGKLQKQLARGGRPVVGDWVAIRLFASEGKGMVQAVLPRRTKFSRKAAGLEVEEQVLAANVDVVFIMASLDVAVNLRRLERFIASSWESGAQPVVVLTKADLCQEISQALQEVSVVAADVPVQIVSAVDGQGLEELRSYFTNQRTVACLGPSGVGKSTLINALAGEELLAVQEVRERDSKGRHTTSHRELVPLPGGGIIMDTPGLRELHLWDLQAGLESAFSEIDVLAAECRFRDCQHESEPGCAVRAAVEAGQVEQSRLDSYHKLQRELEALEARQEHRMAGERKRQARIANKSLKALYRNRSKPR